MNKPPREYVKIRPAILNRDMHRCCKCRETTRLEVHHINGSETDNRAENLRTLCYFCHLVAPVGEGYWEWEATGEAGWDKLARHIFAKILPRFPEASTEEVARLIAVAREFSYYEDDIKRLHSERICAGIARARREGKRLGRPRAVIDRVRCVELRAQGLSLAQIARETGGTVATVHRIVGKVTGSRTA